MPQRFRNLSYSVPWNLWLLLSGSAIFAFGLKAVALPYGLITGGISGLGLLLFYVTDLFSPGVWYFLLNLPIMAVGWIFISRRFVLYTIFGMVSLSLFIELLPWTVVLENKFLAVMAGGALMGAGAGISLRSLGSAGGTDIIAIFLNQRYNIRVGQVGFTFNMLLFGAGLFFLNPNDVLYSLAMIFISSWVLEYFLGMFNQRKMVIIISDRQQEITDSIKTNLRRGVTLLHGMGAYSGQSKEVMLTIINNIQLKRLEEIIYRIDPKAFTIVGTTSNVLGEGFSRRKQY
ncbi:hypothetical protein PCS_01741 [Desulfocurvibacter africanus PCS]|uniref:DUF2179 domain-containing protein n=1 Tax=Desulfocurvibacter africanus PCS TaxID=1262666 RepID=M5Q1C5_DESAF|nr:YitT family protein [Desulfocurvibacter africanus]EMG37451.1 hypothetical protein PCS_01741 [Desulfocurvibacter africanus PCS]